MQYVDVSKSKKLAETGKKPTKRLFLAGVGLVIAIMAFTFRNNILAAFNPVNIVATIATSNLKTNDGRTNILLLGSDRRSAGGETGRSTLTDTILFVSIGKTDNDVVLISLPRDLWVDLPSGGNSKLNAVYAYEGMAGLVETIETVTGVPIHYYALVDFDLFKTTIDTLGGVEVDVERAFIDTTYPVEGKEGASDSERFQTVSFAQGVQKMDGDMALKYVRSRHGNNGEGTDFARSRRQQRLIEAIKNKAMSVETLINPVKLKELYDNYINNVETNINDYNTVQSFYILSQQININRVVSVVLDDRSTADEGGLLYAPQDTTLYAGQYVLLPRTSDFSQIHAYVQKYLFNK